MHICFTLLSTSWGGPSCGSGSSGGTCAMYSNDHATLQHTHNTQTRRGNTNLLYTVQLQHSENSDTLKKKKNLKQNACYSASVLMIKRISAKICILCVRVKIISVRLNFLCLDLALLVYVGLFRCFHNSLNSDMDYRIIKLHMWSFCMCIQMGSLGLQSHPKNFCKVFIGYDSREISGQVQSTQHDVVTHPCGGHAWLCLILAYDNMRVSALALCHWPSQNEVFMRRSSSSINLLHN